MEQVKLQDIHTLGDHLIQFQFSKKSLRILLSVSIFALLFSFSPIFPLFSHCITSFSMQIFRYITDRNYIFIFFNGILVFLIRNSGLDDETSSPPNTVLESAKKSFHQLVPGVDEKRAREEEVMEVAEKRAREEVMEVEEDRGTETENWDSEDCSGKENSTAEAGFVSITEENREEDEEEEEGIELLSAEELNKKCDDFIRKMREGIRTEAP